MGNRPDFGKLGTFRIILIILYIYIIKNQQPAHNSRSGSGPSSFLKISGLRVLNLGVAPELKLIGSKTRCYSVLILKFFLQFVSLATCYVPLCWNKMSVRKYLISCKWKCPWIIRVGFTFKQRISRIRHLLFEKIITSELIRGKFAQY